MEKQFTREHEYVFRSSDENGAFEIRVNRHCYQVTVETQIEEDEEFPGEEAFFNTDLIGLIKIRDFLTAIIDGKGDEFPEDK